MMHAMVKADRHIEQYTRNSFYFRRLLLRATHHLILVQTYSGIQKELQREQIGTKGLRFYKFQVFWLI